jgi:malonate transporter
MCSISPLVREQPGTSSVRIADLILPVVAVILTGWLVGYTGYLSRALSNALIHFAYNIAMPALLIVTIAQEPAHSLLRWRFLVAFGGGSLLCFFLVFGIMSIQVSRSLASRTMDGMAASMTNTGFVALPVLQAIYGQRAVLPAAIATVFVAVVMFPLAVVLLEVGKRDADGSRTTPMATVKHVVLNPLVISTLVGMLLSVLNLRMPGPVTVYLGIFADALTPCALFAIGLGLSMDGLRANIGQASLLSAVKLVIMPLIVYGLTMSFGPRAPLRHCGRDLRRGTHGQNGLHSCGRVSLRGDAGGVHCFDDNSSFHDLARGLALCAIRASHTHRSPISAASGFRRLNTNSAEKYGGDDGAHKPARPLPWEHSGRRVSLSVFFRGPCDCRSAFGGLSDRLQNECIRRREAESKRFSTFLAGTDVNQRFERNCLPNPLPSVVVIFASRGNLHPVHNPLLGIISHNGRCLYGAGAGYIAL